MSIERIQVDFTFNYGSHSPRPNATPLFTKTRHDLIVSQDTPCEDCGLTYSVLQKMLADPAQAPKVAHIDMELHHEIEWAVMQADGDLVKAFNRLSTIDQADLKAQFPDFDPTKATPDNLTAFLDGPWNARHVLCLEASAPVLMGDGSAQPIAELRVGDYVIGHDGRAHRVTAAWSRWHEGELVSVDGVGMTTNHPVLTPLGWLRADALKPGLPVVSHMGRMGFVEGEILDSVVVLDAVDMVNALLLGQRSTEMLFHHEAMFGHAPEGRALPQLQPDIPAAVVAAATVLAGQAVEYSQSLSVARGVERAFLRAGVDDLSPTRRVGVGVAANHTDLDVEGRATGRRPALVMELDASCHPSTRAGAQAVVLELGQDQEGLSAPLAEAHLAARVLAVTRWRPIRQIRRVPFRGQVYDITVEDSHSFMVAGPEGMVVHNCRPCHIAQHPTPDYKGVHRVGRHYGPNPNELAVDVTKDGVDPEAPVDDTPAITAAKAAAHHVAKIQGAPVAVEHPHQGVISTHTGAPHGPAVVEDAPGVL